MSSLIRRLAQAIRHAPGLHSLGPVWNLLRPLYQRILFYLSDQTGLPVRVGGQYIRLHPLFASISWETVEAASYHSFAHAVRSGDVIYDIGAHIGTYSIIALKRSAPSGKVVAYEPHLPTREYLLRHLQWNGADDRVIVRPVCCSVDAGEADFYCLPDTAEGSNSLIPLDGFQRQRVQVTTLDAEVAQLGLIPSVIKIDVEGAEWEVLKGAEATLSRHRPTLLVSLHPGRLAASGTDTQAVLAWLATCGYHWDIIDRDHEIHVLAVPRTSSE